jgi:hypothetical protein
MHIVSMSMCCAYISSEDATLSIYLYAQVDHHRTLDRFSFAQSCLGPGSESRTASTSCAGQQDSITVQVQCAAGWHPGWHPPTPSYPSLPNRLG